MENKTKQTDETAMAYEPTLADDIFDKDYRIEKETGVLTGVCKFYPQYLSKRAWRKPKWEYYYIRIGESTIENIVSHPTFKEALEWLKFKVEKVRCEYYYIGS